MNVIPRLGIEQINSRSHDISICLAALDYVHWELGRPRLQSSLTTWTLHGFVHLIVIFGIGTFGENARLVITRFVNSSIMYSRNDRVIQTCF